jgi:uncharacterized membrane protein YhiD involved in acid resistance
METMWQFRLDPVWDFFLVPLVAFICGGLIGLNREFGKKAAGLRTHILVCLGCALYTEMSIYGFGSLSGVVPRDPARVAANIVTGIGFIGAGAIWKQGVNTVGLTTAATIWITGAIGIACAAGFYLHALGTTFLTLIVLTFLRWVEDQIRPRRPEAWYATLIVEATEEQAPAVIQRGQEMAFHRDRPKGEHQGLTMTAIGNGYRRLEWRIAHSSARDLDHAVAEFAKIPGVREARWEVE